ncbi:SpoIIE family protein phosphatase [Catenulispora subtropica]|uniref:SpoIIE family protein phosphatase n=1 Tax=Catenulispora subtropica TaxID=450798 RepID=UPI0031E488AF
MESEELLLRASAPVLERLHRVLVDTKVSVVLTDARARVLVRRAGEHGLNRHLDAVQLAEGFSYHEADAGTNGIGTALVEGRLAVVLGEEHFADRYLAFACAGAPIRDPFSGRIRGVVDLTSWSRDANPLMAALAAEAAENIELRLLEQYSARERTLLAESRRGAAGSGSGTVDGGAAVGDEAQVRMEQQVRGGVGQTRRTGGRLPASDAARDSGLIRSKAAELVAAARRDVVTIPLTDGRHAKLTARTGRTAAGTEVVTVEAEMTGAERGEVTKTPLRTASAGGIPGPVQTVGDIWDQAEDAAYGAGESGELAWVADGSLAGASASASSELTWIGDGSSATASTSTSSRPSSTAAGTHVMAPPLGGLQMALSTASDTRSSTETRAAVSVPNQLRPTSRHVEGAAADASESEDRRQGQGQGQGRIQGQGQGQGRIQGQAQGRIQSQSQSPAQSHDRDEEPAQSRFHEPTVPPFLPIPPTPPATAISLLDPASAPELVLVGEPTVGRIAVAARQRLALLLYASGRIGTTLDMELTGGELAEIALPDFAQHVAVDLASWVLDGEEGPPPGAEVKLRRVAVRTVRLGKVHRPPGAHVAYNAATAQARCMVQRRPVLDAELTAATAGKRWVAEDPDSSVIAAPIIVQGTVLGVASFYRFGSADPFDEDDIRLAGDLASRAAVCLDNARRFERERAMALALQRSLLPRAFPMQCAVEVASRYLPAQEGVGGDWYDVIPLSGGRVALVVGDVVGHGIHAAATMGRLRTAVRNFCALDLTPEDLLGQLDALVESMDADEAEDQRGVGIIGATCMYVVYDPVTGLCSVAGAGHPCPAVVGRGGSVDFLDLPVGPPLGLGGSSYEAVELIIDEGSTLVLYTDGLVESRDQDIGTGLERLSAVLEGPGRDPEELCAAAIGGLLPARPWDDVALLAARTRRTTADRVASWDVPLSPESVAFLRAEVSRQLRAWRLNDLVFTTELVVSELVTNAIRHATGPVELRLLRDRALICEVADGSSVSPRLRRAQTLDEGGRGLFLVAQLSQRWGTRYTARGKVIWAEQPLPARGDY